MIEALLLIFFGMSNAQQQYVADVACTVVHDPINSFVTNGEKVSYVFTDGTFITYPLYTGEGKITVHSVNGTILN